MTGLGRAAPLVVAASLLTACAPARPQTDADKLERVEAEAAEIERRFSDVQHISVAAAGRLIEAGRVVFVDVREPEERAVSTLPGAIGADEYERDPDAFGDATVVAYCTIGERSSRFARRQAAEGRRVLNLRGSILAWTHAGAPLVSDGSPTRRVHVYGSDWDLAPERYEITVR